MKKFCFLIFIGVLSVLYVQQAAAQKQSHKDYADMKLSDCNDCHKSEGIAPNHDADWVRGHRTVASRAGHNCGECHKQSFCLDCHSGGGIDAKLETDAARLNYIPKSHRSDFISIHPIKAQDNPQSCKRCHDQKYCNECHSRFPKGSLRIKSHMMLGADGQGYSPANASEHATEARRNLQSCASCHPEGDVCIQCHSSGKVRPHPKSWRAGNFRERTDGKVCRKCHLPGTY
ncbi:MAG: cytochrome C [Geobacter sp.]|nr:cytochrome C [Geobacter sp.]